MGKKKQTARAHARDAAGKFSKQGKGGDATSQQQRNVAARNVKAKRRLTKLQAFGRRLPGA